jgi:basic membrane protein A
MKKQLCILLFCLLLIPCQASIAVEEKSKPMKVGFLCVGPINDNGWNYAHNKGRLYLEKNMPGQVTTIMAESVPESAEAERVLEKMIAQGAKLIFTTSYGYLDPDMRVAARHPDVTFMQVNRPYAEKNIGTYFSWQYQPMYMAGVAAGRMTKTNKLGYIAAHPVPPLMQAINAFTLGARSVNPKVTTKVIWINSWSDPPKEAEAIKGLVESGVDVIGHCQDNQNTVAKTAESLGVYCTGFYNDAHELAPKKWLTGACLDWGPLYVQITKSVMNHTWKSESIVKGMEGGYIKLSSFGPAVPDKVRKEIKSIEDNVKNGKMVVFQGPLKDRDGKLRLAAGDKADFKWLSEMVWFVPGVEGALAAK